MTHDSHTLLSDALAKYDEADKLLQSATAAVRRGDIPESDVRPYRVRLDGAAIYLAAAVKRVLWDEWTEAKEKAGRT